MKRLLFTILILSPVFLAAQFTVVGEYYMDPFKSLSNDVNQVSPEGQSVIKELNLGIQYQLIPRLSIKAGITRVDKRNASSIPYFQDFFIAGSIPQFINLTLSHSSRIRNYSTYAGVQLDFNRFHVGGNMHISKSVFKDEAILGREYTTFTGEIKESFFEIDYENITFFKADLNISYELLKSKKGNLSIVLKYMRDFSDNELFTVREYAPEVKEMVESFPGSSYYDIDDFLIGGPLYYDREFWGVGLRMSYNLGVRKMNNQQRV